MIDSKFSQNNSSSMYDNNKILEVKNLSFCYPSNSANTLNDISFSISKSSICGLLGPNGSGKSTLFRCCMNFLRFQEGTVKVAGEDILSLAPSRLAKYIAYVPQENKQPFPFLVEDMVLMGRTSRMTSSFRPKKEDIEKANICMEKVGISHLHHRPFNQLSGGQRQLVLIARALAQESPLMLLDEPSSALDFSNQILLWQRLKELANEGIAILVCSHDPNHILWFCDDAIIVKQGNLVAKGHPHTLLENDVFSNIYQMELGSHKIDNTVMVYPKTR